MSVWSAEYKRKLATADEAVKVVKNGDVVEYGHFAALPWDLDAALARRKDELTKVHVRGCTLLFVPEVFKADKSGETFLLQDASFSGLSRKMKAEGEIYCTPQLYHEIPRTYSLGLRPINVLFLPVTPMDNNGFFSLSTTCASFVDVLKSKYTTQKGLRVVLEVNKNLPWVQGDNVIHISDADIIVENQSNHSLIAIPKVESNDIDEKIANIIMDEMVDGACLQLGIGGMPNLIGKKLVDSDLKELGCHTEMFVDAYMDLFNAGKLTNKRKTLDQGKSVFTFSMGSEKLYEFLKDNPSMRCKPVSYTNDPAVIGQNDNVFSICSCLSVDLFGNVSSESVGYKQISATGGQLDYHFGSMRSKGGKGFVCMPSAKRNRDGKLVSNIVENFEVGTQISVPGNMTNYVVTEYGARNLKGLTTWAKVEALSEIAHPDFVDDILKAAEKARIWRASNKRI